MTMNTLPKKNIQREKLRVKIFTTDGWEIQGNVSIPSGGYNARLSDFLNGEQMFIALTDAMVYDTHGTLLAEKGFLSVNKPAIKLVLEDPATLPEPVI